MTTPTAQWRLWARSVGLACLGGLIGWHAFVAQRPVPVLDWFDLAVHETGHLLAFAFPDLVMFMAGSFAQIAFPAGVAVYFLWKRNDLAAGGFCLAWAGTAAWDVSVYIADAPRQALPLIGGGTHDWAYILGHFDAIDRAGAVSGFVETMGAVAVLAGIAVALIPVAAVLWTPGPSARRVPPVRSGGPTRERRRYPAPPGGDPWAVSVPPPEDAE